MYEIKIKNTNGVLTVSSLQIARDFGKQHKHVLESIEHIKAEISALTMKNGENPGSIKPEFSVLTPMFVESTYKSGTGKAYKCYDVTRDGFALLVMGFTRKEALAWKLKYIKAFNNMEKQLIEIHSNMDIAIEKYLTIKSKTPLRK